MNHVRDAQGGSRGHEADHQRAMRDALAEIRLLFHVLVVDVGVAEIAGDTGEQHHIGFAHGLRKCVMLTDRDAVET